MPAAQRVFRDFVSIGVPMLVLTGSCAVVLAPFALLQNDHFQSTHGQFLESGAGSGTPEPKAPTLEEAYETYLAERQATGKGSDDWTPRKVERPSNW